MHIQVAANEKEPRRHALGTTARRVSILVDGPAGLTLDDSLGRAGVDAGTAVDAVVGVNDSQTIVAQLESTRRAGVDASAAAHAILGNLNSHFSCSSHS